MHGCDENLALRICGSCNLHWYGLPNAPCPGTGCRSEATTQSLVTEREDLRSALRSLVDRIRRQGGYSTPEDQEALWHAEALLR